MRPARVATVAVASLVAQLSLLGAPVRAETPVSGSIVADTTWAASNSPYVLTSSVTVEEEVTLTIEPGVRVEGTADASLNVLGLLSAVGTEPEPIVFTAEGGGSSVGWQGIKFGGTPGSGDDESQISFAVIERASFGIDYRYDAPAVSHVEFRNNYIGVYLFYPGQAVTLADSIFVSNAYAVTGIADPTISLLRNDFWKNFVSVIPSGNAPTDRWEIHQNDILNTLSGGHALMTESGTGGGFVVSATDNWWGTTDAAAIEALILDEADDPARAPVEWEPPSPGPNTAWPPPPVSHERAVSLTLKGHLVARGSVTVEDDFTTCVDGVTVHIQRKQENGWKTVESVKTGPQGKYKAKIKDRAGTYRAEVDELEIGVPVAEVCEADLSPRRRV